tara:strand:- start:1351 stop:1656 length:306 start_codon:yes stop_codon:yes gene_type:complete
MAKYSRFSFIRGPKLFDNMFLDTNEIPSLRASVNDEVYTIEEDYNERPDLLAHKLYESSELWWVFASRNPDIIKDPIRDFKAGVTINLPSAERVTRVTQGS